MGVYDTREALAKLADMDPELEEYLAGQGKENPMVTMSFATMVQIAKDGEITMPPTSNCEYVIEVSMRDGHQSNLRVHKPYRPGPACPLVVLIHGGGFCCGHNTYMSVHARAIANLYSATVVSISYRLAPEFKFPTAPQDVWDTLRWLSLSENAMTLGADLSAGFIIGGVSAGANLAAVTCQKWITQHMSPSITGMWLDIPLIFDTELVPDRYRDLWISREQNAEAIIINKPALEFALAAYEPDVRSPDFSPVNTKSPHRGLPSTYIQVCGQDPVRDDGLIYEKMLRESNVATKLDVYPGVPHGYASIFTTLKSAHQNFVDTMKGFGWLLGKPVSEKDCEDAFAAADAFAVSISHQPKIGC